MIAEIPYMQMFPLTEATVLDYFALSQFYDRTCTNEQLRMQTRFTTTAAGGQAIVRLEDMVGIEYVVHKVLPPHLFIIHKRLRHSEADVDVLASYYILDGTIYQAPSLLSLLKCRVTSSLAYLNEAIQMSTDNLRYDPDAKAYLTTSNANAVQDQSRINAAEARALDAYLNL